MRLIIHCVLALVLVACASAQAIYHANSCNIADVNDCVNGTTNNNLCSPGGHHTAIDGDIIMLPAGTCDWTTQLLTTVGMSLLGAGVATTTIIDDVPKTTCVGAASLLRWNTTSTVPMRISSFTIQGSAADTAHCNHHLQFSSFSHAVRIDHITIANQLAGGMIISQDTWGVADHISMCPGTPCSDLVGIKVHHEQYLGDVSGDYGDNSWAQPDCMGAPGTIANPTSSWCGFYVESSTFNYINNAADGASCDSYGSRIVIRFDTGMVGFGNHGLDTTGRYRSCRYAELYNNTVNDGVDGTGGHVGTVGLWRGGTALVFNNKFQQISSSTSYVAGLNPINFRDTDSFVPFGYCDGQGQWDNNTGTVYASGAAVTGSTTDDLLVSGTPWSSSQWAPTSSIAYSIVNTTAGWGSIILSSTTNTVVTHGPTQGVNGGQNPVHTWTNGDSFQILSAYPCLDQNGRGQGSYISGTTPSPTGWTGEAPDPMVAFSNMVGPVGSEVLVDIIQSNSLHVVANRDYYDEALSGSTDNFNGTSGSGVGTLASRPGTCTAGVFYWATDLGNWNQSGSGGQGEMFKCTSTNTWQLYYVPMTYPHPLVGAMLRGISKGLMFF